MGTYNSNLVKVFNRKSVVTLSGGKFTVDDITYKKSDFAKYLMKHFRIKVRPNFVVSSNMYNKYHDEYWLPTNILIYGDKGITSAHMNEINRNTEKSDLLTISADDFVTTGNKNIADAEELKNRRRKFATYYENGYDTISVPATYDTLKDSITTAVNKLINIRNKFNLTDTIELNINFHKNSTAAQFYGVTFNTDNNGHINNPEMFDKMYEKIISDNNENYFKHVTGVEIVSDVFGMGTIYNNVVKFSIKFTFDDETTKHLNEITESFDNAVSDYYESKCSGGYCGD